MADSSAALLQALFSGAGSGGQSSAGALSSFSNTVAENDIFSQLAPAVMGAKFNRSTWTPTENLATSAAQAFLGGILGEYGKQRRAEQLTNVASVLPSLYADPLNTAAPAGVDPEAFAQLQLSALQQNAMRDAAQAKEQRDFQVDIAKAGLISKAQEQGKIGAYDVDGLQDLGPLADAKRKRDSDADKYLTDARDFLKSGIGGEFQATKSHFDTMKKLAKDNSAAGNTALATSFLKVYDPSSIAREGEVTMVSEMGPRLQAVLGKDFGRWFSSDGTMLPETKLQLLKVAGDKYNSVGADYSKLYDTSANYLTKRGVDPSDLAAPKYDPFDIDIYAGRKSPKSRMVVDGATVKNANVIGSPTPIPTPVAGGGSAISDLYGGSAPKSAGMFKESELREIPGATQMADGSWRVPKSKLGGR
ncbi:hypothetical protein UFOVP591_19 [uncultured Caudovirales phage]|uniref:Uncharacterized protein n=1 Tax=uncultured Caudovirales phage TaxID=2100421 RepID=A0A6J5MW22_9CAUD|nr:hypothetical protein UFOVP591_19 [uncultured Caudovirales phage]